MDHPGSAPIGRHDARQEAFGADAPSADPLDLALAVLRCTRCKAADFAVRTTTLTCKRCAQAYRLEAGIIDALPSPSQDVVDELSGMMREANFDGDLAAFKIIKVPAVTTLEARKQISRDMPFDYYGSTELNFLQALRHVRITGRERVLEIGGHDDYPFLRAFRDRGCTCYETNIYCRYDDEATRSQWPVRIVADMQDLPYRDGSFDIVLLSATSHHGHLPAVMAELGRVTRNGGIVINVNEPIRGVLKHAFAGKRVARGEQDQTHRDDLVHEHEYSIFEYLREFRRAGFTLEASLFSEYYDRRLEQAQVVGVRFARLASAVSRVWRSPIVRQLATGPGLWIGQAAIGLQMNVVLRKVDRCSSGP